MLFENVRGQINNRMQQTENNFGVKYGNGKNISEMLNG